MLMLGSRMCSTVIKVGFRLVYQVKGFSASNRV